MSDTNILEGKSILFLGSSVTYGEAAGGVSFADHIAERNNCSVLKEAVSGTTLVDDASDSYIARMKKISGAEHFDLVVCQLSTNDAAQGKLLGTVSKGFDRNDFDVHTISGAIEYVIAYSRETWNCPVAFYTNPRFSSAEYAAMNDQLKVIAAKWNVPIIRMYDDAAFNRISHEERVCYMADDVHPTDAGYRTWITPYVEAELIKILK